MARRRGRRPTTYVMKYLLKTLGGAGDVVEEADRLAAWATHVGMRRLSLIGLQPGTVGRWRAAHRLLRSGEPSECPRARAIVHAMRRARWGLALALLGTIADDRRFTTWTETRVDRWGDTVTRTAGWAHAKTHEVSFICRPVKWTIVERWDRIHAPEISGGCSCLLYPRGPRQCGDGATAPTANGPPDLKSLSEMALEALLRRGNEFRKEAS